LYGYERKQAGDVSEQNVQGNFTVKEGGSKRRLRKSAQFYSGDQGECNWWNMWQVWETTGQLTGFWPGKLK